MVIRTALVILMFLHGPPPAPGEDAAGARGDGGEPAPRILEHVDIGGERFELEVAADERSRAKGLMGREEIPDGCGMLFVYPRARPQSFWMAGCLVDIDIMFLDTRGRVVAVHEMTIETPRSERESRGAYERRLRRYRSRRPAQFAIELGAESIKRLGIEVGDQIDLDVDRLRTMAR